MSVNSNRYEIGDNLKSLGDGAVGVAKVVAYGYSIANIINAIVGVLFLILFIVLVYGFFTSDKIIQAKPINTGIVPPPVTTTATK